MQDFRIFALAMALALALIPGCAFFDKKSPGPAPASELAVATPSPPPATGGTPPPGPDGSRSITAPDSLAAEGSPSEKPGAPAGAVSGAPGSAAAAVDSSAAPGAEGAAPAGAASSASGPRASGGPEQVQLAALAPKKAPAGTIPPPAEAARPASSGRVIAVVGDSLAVGIGMTLDKHLKPYGDLSCLPLGKVSSGLISRKFHDWEKVLADVVRDQKPQAVVVMMGGNDSQNPIAGKAPGAPEWTAAYEERVKSFLSIAAGAGVRVFWVGMPVMREEDYARRVRAANEAAERACRATPGCVYIDAWSYFADGSGNYVQAKVMPDGKEVSLRAKDGVHLTMTGYDYLSRHVLDQMARVVELGTKKSDSAAR